MKKYLPYILGTLLVGGIIALFVTGGGKKKKKQKMDERVTLRRQDKIPYGTYAAFNNLQYIFPNAKISVNRDEPGYWDSLSTYDSNQALIIITNKFNADEDEMEKLIAFIEKGNDVFVSARTLSYSAGEMLDCSVNGSAISSYYTEEPTQQDSLKLVLNDIPFGQEKSYTYPGKKMDASFYAMDVLTTEVLGEDAIGEPNFVRLRAGKGNLYVHLAPLAFSNYFLLYKENIAYYEKALSVISEGTEKVVWDEYYLNKKFINEEDKQDKKGWFSVLMNAENENGQRSFRAAFWVLLLLLLLYVLIEMRRKQRYIPVVTKPRNDSLDFVKTIGRLYFDKGDHMNLCRKMSAYFLEHVRAKYKLTTGSLNEDFIKKLQYKSGAPEVEVSNIVMFIRHLETAPGVSHRELSNFHQQLETFYNKT